MKHKTLKHFSRDARGTAAIEFAVILPVLITMLLGMIDAGLYFHLRTLMTTETRSVTRDLALGNLTAVTAKTQLETNLEDLADLPYTVTVTIPDPLVPTDVNVSINVNLDAGSLNADYALMGVIPFSDIDMTTTMRALE